MPNESRKPDNSTQAEIHVLSDKIDTVHKRIDDSSLRLKQEIDGAFEESKKDRLADKREVAKTLKEDRIRNRWITGTIVTVCTILIVRYLDAVQTKLDMLVETSHKQSTDIAVIRTNTATKEEARKLYDRLDEEVRKLRSEFDQFKRN